LQMELPMPSPLQIEFPLVIGLCSQCHDLPLH
jgi:hypothetical protein